MKTKIWHQSFTVLSDVPTYRDALKNRIAKVVSPDTEVVMHGQIVGTYPSEYPGTDLKYEYLFELHGLQWIAAALQAEKEGYDGMVLASFCRTGTGILVTADIASMGMRPTLAQSRAKMRSANMP